VRQIIRFLLPYALNANPNIIIIYRGAGKSLARPTSRCILFDGEKISFDASLLYIYYYFPPIVIINALYENQNLLSL
jgi:hypothetical protein